MSDCDGPFISALELISAFVQKYIKQKKKQEESSYLTKKIQVRIIGRVLLLSNPQTPKPSNAPVEFPTLDLTNLFKCLVLPLEHSPLFH